jgi:hypothetical protein
MPALKKKNKKEEKETNLATTTTQLLIVIVFKPGLVQVPGFNLVGQVNFYLKKIQNGIIYFNNKKKQKLMGFSGSTC